MRHELPSANHVETVGTAQSPTTYPWARNLDGARTEAEAVDLARRWGVVIPEDVRFVWRDELVRNQEAYAEYGGFQSYKPVRWADFYVQGKIPVKVRRSVLGSDEMIVAVLAHEMHELNTLRAIFEERETMDCSELNGLIKVGVPGNLHDRAWDVADKLVQAMRGGETC